MRRVLTEIVPVGESERFIQPWAAARYRAEGSYAGYLADLDVLWCWANAQQNIALGVRCALIYASILSLSGNLTPELLVGLVTVGTPEGKWSVVAALEHIRQMPDSEQQAKSIKALMDAGCDLPWEVALGVARGIAEEWYRADALATLAPRLPPALLPEALEAARAIADERHRARALAALAPYLSTIPHHQQLWWETLPILATRGRAALLSDLAALTPWLEKLATLDELDDIAQSIIDVSRCWP